MSVFKIFIASKKDLSISVEGNQTNNTVASRRFEYKSGEQQGMAGARETALYSLVETLKSFKTKECSVPVQVFVISALSDMIHNETYKYWLMTGKKNDGTDVNKNELMLWQEYHKLMSKNGMLFIIKSINDANFNGVPKFNQAGIAYNKCYYDWVWKQVHKDHPKGPAIPEEPASPEAV